MTDNIKFKTLKDLSIINIIFTPDEIKELVEMLECYSCCLSVWTDDKELNDWRDKIKANINTFKEILNGEKHER